MQPWINGKDVDREIAESTPCPKCGAGMSFDPRYEEGDTSEKPEYHAWAICDGEPECGYEFEF